MAYVQDAVAAARSGGPLPNEKANAAAFTTRAVETYDPRKASELFASFVQHGTWQVPTLTALRGAWESERRQLPATDAAAYDRAAAQTHSMFAKMRKARVGILAGSDRPLTGGVPPIHEELASLVRAGMTPAEALHSATRAPAEFLGRVASEGAIAIGKKANLVLLHANPLDDIANTRRTAAVVLRGRLITEADLQRFR